ncbi:hypothetical protein E3C22_03465 [Jiella endophytica]|uniref:Uncharacterized protein n=1 Tax=Jiella endophytica TaxID=2558362 RepID=A0A4Y8RTA0_9HYPH|nr:hypothetical protein [Jiella endophytica]TFF27529.1 hypothetical protein E3C22_03465 [Jiella endophytica]
MSRRNLQLSEPFGVSDIYVSGCTTADDLGDGMARLTFYSVQRCPHTGAAEYVVQAKIVLSRSALSDLALTAAAGPEPLAPAQEPALQH